MQLASSTALGRLACVYALAAALGGCADASGRFQAFEDRRVALDASAGANNGAAGPGSCEPPKPGVVHGPALVALETKTSPGIAILLFGEVETPELDGKTAVKFSYQPVDARDRRTLVGDHIVVGPFLVNPDGSFDMPTPNSTLPGSANAILLGVPITSQLTLHGSICSVTDFYCGKVTGTTSAPLVGPTSGQFGLTLVPSIDEIPARPRYGCAEDALAPELE